MAGWLLNRFSEEAKQRVRQGLCVDRGQEVLLHDGPVLVVKCPSAGGERSPDSLSPSYTWAVRADLDAGLAALAVEARPQANVTADQLLAACGKNGFRLMERHAQPEEVSSKRGSAKGRQLTTSKSADWQGNAEWGIANLLLRCRCCMSADPGDKASQKQSSALPSDEQMEAALTAEEDQLLAMPSTPPRSDERRGKIRSRSRTGSLSIWGAPDRLQPVPEERSRVVSPEWKGMQVVCAVPDRCTAEALVEQAARLLPAGMAEAIRFVPSDALARLSLKAPGMFDAALVRHADPADSATPAQDIAAALQVVRTGGRIVYLAGSKVDRAGDAAVSKALDINLGGATPMHLTPALPGRTPTEDPTLRTELAQAEKMGAGWCIKRRSPEGDDHFLCALEKKGA
ncbi:hypothetical protein WJX73_004707 [Symbiochloris irregularis]|uniref:Uncharacterized protein n=1 Tax=Symbiochloris irregularis TaxID=706552 RepID=A0AAW1PZQ4_9CHLO